MFSHTVEYCESPEQRERLVTALNCVCVTRPYLSGLAILLKIYVMNAVSTAGITASGRLLINPDFLAQVKRQELPFVLAHELMHLVLQTHERQGKFPNPELINIAHDFIINDDLMGDFMPNLERPSLDVLHWPDYEDRVNEWKPAKEYLLEELVSVLKRENIFPEQAWGTPPAPAPSSSRNSEKRPPAGGGGGGGGGTLGDYLKDAGFTGSNSDEKETQGGDKKPKNKNASNSNKKNPQGSGRNAGDKSASKSGQNGSQGEGENADDQTASQDGPNSSSSTPQRPIKNNRWDALSDEDERQIFPELSPETLAKDKKEVQDAAIRSYSEAILADALDKKDQSWRGMGGEAGNYYKNYSRLQSVYNVPWEMALQHWFDAVAPGDRSFAKASRRGAWRTDVVLPGRKREGWTLHIVLDTSGSMYDILPKALGAIAHFCEYNNVETVHIIQIDTIIHQDEYVQVDSLENIKILGLGGNDMQPAWDRLMEDPEVEAVVVVSDGGFEVPPEPPFEVLWAITDTYYKSWFKPSYGTIVYIENMD